MPIESANYIAQLNTAYPLNSDKIGTGARHIRLLKKVLLQTLPNANATISASPQALAFVNGLTSDAQTQLNTLASDLATMSADLASQIRTLSATMSANKLNVSATAYASERWGGRSLFVQSATPAAFVNGDIWMVP